MLHVKKMCVIFLDIFLSCASAYYTNTFLNYWSDQLPVCCLLFLWQFSLCLHMPFTTFITSSLLLHAKKLISSKFTSFVCAFKAALFYSWKLVCLCQEYRILEHGMQNSRYSNRVNHIVMLWPLFRVSAAGVTSLVFRSWAVGCCLHLPVHWPLRRIVLKETTVFWWLKLIFSSLEDTAVSFKCAS